VSLQVCDVVELESAQAQLVHILSDSTEQVKLFALQLLQYREIAAAKGSKRLREHDADGDTADDGAASNKRQKIEVTAAAIPGASAVSDAAAQLVALGDVPAGAPDTKDAPAAADPSLGAPVSAVPRSSVLRDVIMSCDPRLAATEVSNSGVDAAVAELEDLLKSILHRKSLTADEVSQLSDLNAK
jgi:hypothetical protein